MLKIWTASPNETLIGISSARRLTSAPRPGGGDEEVEQDGGGAGRDDEHVAARPEPREQRLAGERGEHRPDRRVNGVATVAQHLGPGPGGDRMTGGDDAELRLGHAESPISWG